MARKSVEKKTGEEKLAQQQERARRLLEKLRFAQMMFDFYMAKVE